MATNPDFIRENGPFIGTSCLPWRQRGKSGEGVRSPMAINVDFTRGTIRPRPGAGVFSARASAEAYRFMGLSGYRKADGGSILVGIALIEDTVDGSAFPWQLEFQVYNTNGTKLSAVRMDEHPLFEIADPDNWYSMAQYNLNLYMTSKQGRVLVYNYEKDKESPEYAETVIIPRYTGVSQFSSHPQGSIVVEHERRVIVAGFDGTTSHSLDKPLNSTQNVINEDLLDRERGQAVLTPRELICSEDGDPGVFAADRIVAFPGLGAITGMASTPGGLLVLGENNVHLVQFNPVQEKKSDLHQYKLIAEGIGCVSHRSVCHGRGITAWLSHDGIYMYQGQSVTKISDDIGDLWAAGRWEERPISSIGRMASSLGYPFVIQKPRMDRACGAFDQATNTFVWALPLAGHSDYNRLIVTFYPATTSWSVSAPVSTASGVTSFRPTNFATLHDNGRKRLIFSDFDTGLYGYNESQYDYDQTAGAAVDVEWLYQSPMHDLGAGVSSSPKALQIRQKATGSRDPASWYIEAERNFDTTENTLSSAGSLHTSPQTAPPTSATSVDHYWDQGKWDTEAKWQRGEIWRARYPVGPVNGNCFRVALHGEQGAHRQEIMDYSIEIERKRDVT